jgi:hypothetical protein
MKRMLSATAVALGVLIGPCAFGQTAPAQRIEVSTFSADYFDGTNWIVRVYGAIGTWYASAYWIQFDPNSSTYYDCRTAAPPAAFTGSITVSPTGKSAELRFVPTPAPNCPFSEVVVTCRATDDTQFYIVSYNINRKDGETGRATTSIVHRINYEMTSPECSIPGVDAEYISNFANASMGHFVEPH